MKTSVFLSILVLYSTNVFAQFARIKDKDGFVNIRSKPSVSSTVVGKVPDGHIFWSFEREGDWYPIDYAQSGETVSGYIHHSRIKFIPDLPSVPLKEKYADRILFQNGDLGVEIRTRKFVEREHTIQHHHSDNAQFISSIDNKPIWGTDGELPKVEYSQVTVTLANKQIILPKKEIENLFEPGFHHTSVNYDKVSSTVYISSSNSDGAGAYVVLWMIKDGKQISRTVSIPF